jgi:hypothetical protein
MRPPKDAVAVAKLHPEHLRSVVASNVEPRNAWLSADNILDGEWVELEQVGNFLDANGAPVENVTDRFVRSGWEIPKRFRSVGVI